MRRIQLVFFLFALFTSYSAFAQPSKIGGGVNYAVPGTYTVAGITVIGVEYSDVLAIKMLSGLQVGDEVDIPGERISKAIRALWKQKLFSEIEIYAAEIRGEDIYLVIALKEMPRMSRFKFEGIKKTEADNIREDIQLISGQMITENLKNKTINSIKNYFIDKGFLNVECSIEEQADINVDNSAMLVIKVNKGKKVKIQNIYFAGVSEMKENKLKRKMKDTKERRIWSVFKTSKYIESEFEVGKSSILQTYNENGYRNARILSDSIVKLGPKRVDLHVNIEEGQKFYFRDISFVGNTIYTTGRLDSIMNIDRGEVYDLSTLEARLYMNMSGQDITSLYQDNGYLTYHVYPVETLVESDSIDIEVRMHEGKKFRIGKVSVVGNTKTNDHVVYREIRTRPGDLFSRSDIIRTQRELAQLGYFDPQAFNVVPTQNPEDGTVDIEYEVVEKASDQVELSGGWGGGRVVGSLGLTFTNFSLKNVFKKGAWRPLPSGDGQRLSLRAQTNGAYYQSYSFSFVEPWLGGKKPNSLSVSLWHSVQSNGQKKYINDELNPLRQSLKITGGSLGLGKRLQKPDDWFLVHGALSYQYFDLNNFGSFFSFREGYSNNLSISGSIQRNSVSDPTFPTWGSEVKLSAKITPPYSLFDGIDDYSGMTDQEKFDWVEYYKLKFTARWYTTLFSHKMGEEGNSHNLVLATNVGFGFLGAYNNQIGLSPFERFYLGGVYLSGYVLDAREIVNLRGYDDLSLTFPSSNTGAPLVTKYNMELRYPLSTNPNAFIYLLGFLEAGKTWQDFSDYNPLNVMRSGGMGLRVFLPMFGMLGLDYGWRFDDVPNAPDMAKGQFHFSLGMNLGEL